jgi:uncharacterized paraquat-inducible protein A
MRIRRADVLFLVAAVLVVAGVSLLPSPRDQNPKVPSDVEHRDRKTEPECLRCHAAGAARPLQMPPHPKRLDCLRCHAREPSGSPA